MPQGQANPEKCGRKVDESEYVWIVTSLITQSVPDARIVRQMAEKYGFKISLPSLMAFRRNYYPTRLEALKKETIRFKQEQSGQIQTFIDESLVQARALKNEIDDQTRQLQLINRQLDFIRKFEGMFQNAIDRYVEAHDPANPQDFIGGVPASADQQTLTAAIEAMGQQGREALSMYIETRQANTLVKLATYLSDKLRSQREAVVDIHKNIFKSYRNLSISQEMTVIFERYNGIIVEEFFPDKANIDPQKFARVNQKIRALFDELNTRYQGVETPSEHGRNPLPEEIRQLAQGAIEVLQEPPSQAPTIPGRKGRQPAKSTVIARQRAQAAREVQEDADEPLTDQQAEQVLKEVEAQISTIQSEPDLFAQALEPTPTTAEPHV